MELCPSKPASLRNPSNRSHLKLRPPGVTNAISRETCIPTANKLIPLTRPRLLQEKNAVTKCRQFLNDRWPKFCGSEVISFHELIAVVKDRKHESVHQGCKSAMAENDFKDHSTTPTTLQNTTNTLSDFPHSVNDNSRQSSSSIHGDTQGVNRTAMQPLSVKSQVEPPENGLELVHDGLYFSFLGAQNSKVVHVDVVPDFIHDLLGRDP